LAEYHHYIDNLIYLNEALAEKGVLIPNWQEYSETLLIKFCNQGQKYVGGRKPGKS
jgi:hypothetical protein